MTNLLGSDTTIETLLSTHFVACFFLYVQGGEQVPAARPDRPGPVERGHAAADHGRPRLRAERQGHASGHEGTTLKHLKASVDQNSYT